MSKKPSIYARIWSEIQAVLDDRILDAQARFPRLHRFVHFWLMVWRSVERNRLFVRASGLAYMTLLSLIPMLAVAVSVTSSFLKKEGEDRIDQFIVQFVASVTPPDLVITNSSEPRSHRWRNRTNAPPFGTVAASTNLVAAATAPEYHQAEPGTDTNAPAMDGATGLTNQAAMPAFVQAKETVRARREIARSINTFIQNTRSGALGVTGSVLLIFAAISMLSRIETTFNDIWGVERGRSWFMRIVLYWGVISLTPLLLVIALGLASGPQLEGPKEFVAAMPVVGSLVFQLLPVVLLCRRLACFTC
jgi:membrane protein